MKISAHQNYSVNEIGSFQNDEQRHDATIAVSYEMNLSIKVFKEGNRLISHRGVVERLVAVGTLTVATSIKGRETILLL
jgi:hypothetical protein